MYFLSQRKSPLSPEAFVEANAFSFPKFLKSNKKNANKENHFASPFSNTQKKRIVPIIISAFDSNRKEKLNPFEQILQNTDLTNTQ
jgi:hypothetical protein